jgi:serine/threonine protein phosphatase PrpC
LLSVLFVWTCQGLWKVVEDEEAVAHVHRLGKVSAQTATNSLLELAKERYKVSSLVLHLLL